MTAKRVFPVAILTLALAAAGCGSSKKSDGGSGALAKADLAKSADAICVRYNAKIKALGNPSSEAAFGSYLGKLIPLAEQQGAELHALSPAADIKAQWADLLNDYDGLLTSTRQAKTLIGSGDKAGFEKLVKKTSPLSDASDQKLDAFGAPHCGSKSDE